ncbi:NF038120 family PEP-CTERM protein [Janthinobacterium sp. ROICE36]|uniref:NF038120 family PEP-CTERM protein n=1 Tax=Janthinobacterium sp. ROICE36 TaxID=2048670 RepID=UPI0015E123EF|nr:NF038120 family PEP-CTERM protein [Janthinobacterium sp. ROICE36]
MNRLSLARVSPATVNPCATRVRSTVFAALATVSVLASAPAMAGVLSFDTLRPDIYESGQTLNTSSYNLLFLADPTTAAGGGVSGVGAILDGRVGSSCDIAACPQGATGNYLAILNDGGVNFSRSDHQAFTLAGFDYSFIAPVSGLPNMQWGQLQLSGTLGNGQVINTSLAFPGQGSDGNYHFQSASLLSGFSNYAFTGLTFNACIFNDTGACSNSLDFPAFNQGQFALDNINISAVPEPSTYMLMLAGLGAIGMLSRRRTGKFAASTVQGA